jgi:hypothetical protein
MTAFRSFVAVLVTVLTVLSGGVRSPAVDPLRAPLTAFCASDDADQGTLDRGRSVVQARATKPARSHGGDGVSSTATAPPVLRPSHPDGTELASAPTIIDVVPRRVRPHVEHMVFLI